MNKAQAESSEWLKNNINPLLKPLLTHLLKERPAQPRDFMIFWLQTVGAKIERKRCGAQEEEPRDTSHLPDSSEEEQSGEEDKCASPRVSTPKKKHAISAEVYGASHVPADFVSTVVTKSDEQLRLIRDRLSACIFFQSLSAEAMEVLIGAMEAREFAANEQVIAQGEDGNNLYLVASGTLRCCHVQPGTTESVHLRDYTAGEVFGELSLLYKTPRSATITAVAPSLCFCLDRTTFNHIVKSVAERNRQLHLSFLNRVEILQELKDYERTKLCDCLREEIFRKGDFVLRQGEPGDTFYIVRAGRAEAFKQDAEGEEVRVFEYGETDYFGELALLNDELRQASIRVTSDELVLATVSRETFKRLLGPLQDILQRNAAKYEQYVTQRA